MKEYKESDVETYDIKGGSISSIRPSADREDLIYAPLDWQVRGLQQTASGYGYKLTSPYKIRFEGKDYRVYVTCYSNVGSGWFRVRGRKVFCF